MESVGTYPTVVAKSGANWGYIFEFLTTTGKINLYLDKAKPSWGNVAETGVQLKEWTHLAATYDGKTIHYYFNGKLDGTYSNIPGGQIAENADNVHLGWVRCVSSTTPSTEKLVNRIISMASSTKFGFIIELL